MQFPNMFFVDVDKGPVTQALSPLFLGDALANRIGVYLYKDGEPFSPGGSAFGRAVLSGGETVLIQNGVVSENAIYVDLPSGVYAEQGPVKITVSWTDGTTTTTVLEGTGNVRLTETGTIIDPGTIISDVTALIQAIETAVASIPPDYTDLLETIAPVFSESVSYAAGQHVWYDGSLYRFTEYHSAGSWTGADATLDTLSATDATLALAGKPADAKAAGDAIAALESDYDDMVVVTIGDNLTNPAEWYAGAINDTTGEITPNNYYNCSGRIPCTPGETLYLYFRVSDTDIRVRKTAYDKIAFYQEDGTFISVGKNEDSYTVPPLAAYCVQQANTNLTGEGNIAVFRKSLAEMGGVWQPYTETKRLKDSYTPDAVVEQLQAIDGCMRTDVYMDYSMINRLDPAECVTGKKVSYSTGVVSDNSSSFTTDYIEIRGGETLYFYALNGTSKTIQCFAAYDESKQVIPSLGQGSATDHITQSQNMAFVRVSFAYYSPDIWRTPQGCACMANSQPPYIPVYGTTAKLKDLYIRPVVSIYSTDTESEIITKLVTAYNHGDCDVYFERSSYTFGPELEKVSTDYGMTSNEIPIGHGCRYYFNGSTLMATVDLSQHPSAEGEEEFYCNFFGCQRRPSSFEMHDGVLIATDTRYVVHDESSALAGSYRHLYQNMEMHYHTSARQEAIRKCIGGGTGASGVVEIVGCKFTTDGTDACVSYHGNGKDVAGAEFDLNIRNSWFSNNVRAGALSANQTARLFYTGNSSGSAVATYDRWTVTAFLNEVRT